MGINTVHLKKGEPLQGSGMTQAMLLDPCTNVMTGAYLLKRKMVRYGNTWDAVGAYHSETPRHGQNYQGLIFEKLKVLLANRKRPILRED